MENEKKVSMAVIRRLPRYFRYLGELQKQGISRISSAELSRKMGFTASQIRQDLNCFGGFGQQGYGYQVDYLLEKIGEILGLDRSFKVIIIGAGHLGHALANYRFFQRGEYEIIGIFDNAPEVVGTVVNNHTVRHADTLAEFVRERKPEIAILTLPREFVKKTADVLVAAGIKALWNFSYAELDVGEKVAVEHVHLSDSLMTLSYKLTQLGES